MRALAIVALVACSSTSHGPAGQPPRPGSVWHADLECREDPACKTTASDCVVQSPPAVLQEEQCGGAERPPPSHEELDRYAKDRAAQIEAKTWPCRCYCAAAEQQRLEECSLVP